MTADAPASPPAEVEITPDLLRVLLRDQHADLADLPIRLLDAGWDNVMLRIGDDLLARMPRRAIAEDLLRNEQQWLPRLAPGLPLAIPAPLRTGRPDAAYPYVWSILSWIEGEAADLAPPDVSEAPVLAKLSAGCAPTCTSRRAPKPRPGLPALCQAGRHGTANGNTAPGHGRNHSFH